MQVGSQSQTYGASNQVFNKRHFHGDKKKKKKKKKKLIVVTSLKFILSFLASILGKNKMQF